jgi:protein TonB
MNKQKQVPNVKLQKTSVIFMQLGLILALFSVYVILEHETIYKVPVLANYVVEESDDPKIPTDYTIIKPKVKIIKPKVIKPQPVVIVEPQNTFIVVDDITPDLIEPALTPTDDEPDTPVVVAPVAVINIVDEAPDASEDIPEIPFVLVEIAPAFPGCDEGLSKDELRACFNEKMRKHVNKKFNADIAQNLGLESGRKRISIEFIIDEHGEINILRVRAPHKRLEKEAKRVVNLLPTMIPARQQLKNVRVKFNLPIIFDVED